MVFWKINLGAGSNTKGELVGLWALLHLARYFGITKIQVFGDSMVIIKWIEGLQNLNVLSLDFWKEKIMKLKDDFECLKVVHIYRELNNIGDQLSKLSLESKENSLIWWSKKEGVLGPNQKFLLLDLDAQSGRLAIG